MRSSYTSLFPCYIPLGSNAMIPVVIFALLSPESSLIMMLLMLSCTLRYGWIWISRFIHSFFFFSTRNLSLNH